MRYETCSRCGNEYLTESKSACAALLCPGPPAAKPTAKATLFATMGDPEAPPIWTTEPPADGWPLLWVATGFKGVWLPGIAVVRGITKQLAMARLLRMLEAANLPQPDVSTIKLEPLKTNNSFYGMILFDGDY